MGGGADGGADGGTDGGTDGGVGRFGGSKNRLSPKTSKSGNPKSGNSVKPGNSEATEESKFLTSEAKKAFNRLKQAFTEGPILRHFDPKCHIWIETDVSGYSIGEVLSQPTSESGQ